MWSGFIIIQHNHTLGPQDHFHKTVLLALFGSQLLQSTTVPFLHLRDTGVARVHSGINEDRISIPDWLSQCLREATNTEHL